jgi:8-hydroxy-5-deazaflavin:NADPH oxidoreductase
MNTKQTIVVIGATGNMGAEVSKSLANGNYRLLLQANDPDELTALVQEIFTTNPNADVEAINCSVDGSWEADIIITDISASAEKEVAEKIREVANQKIVISITHALHDTNKAVRIKGDISSAEEMQSLLPHSKVVKVFNTSFAHNIVSNTTDIAKTVTLVAGNDPEALQTVFGLFSIAGFNPVIAGDLTVSRALEHMQ